MSKVITTIGRILSPIVVGLLTLEWIFSFLFIELLIFFPGVLALEMKMLYKICEIREQKIAQKIKYGVKNRNLIKVKLVVLEVILISLVLIGIIFLNYRFSGEKKVIIYLGILEMISIILFLCVKKNIYIFEHGKDKTSDTASDTTSYIIEYMGTEEDVKKIIEEFVHEHGFGLDAAEDGLYYSYYDFRTACKLCFTYYFHGEKHIIIQCWIVYFDKEYDLYHFIEKPVVNALIPGDVNAFLSEERKNFDSLVRSIKGS